MPQWMEEHGAVVAWLTGISVAMFVASLIIMPVILIRLPPDYFTHRKRPQTDFGKTHPALRMVLRVGKNVLGAILFLSGLLMLVLPGQGLLGMLIGLMLMDLPGTWRLQKWLVTRPQMLKIINWLRRKAHRKPMVADGIEVKEN